MSNFFVDEETFAYRLGICRECPEYFKFTGNCKVCGCFMRVKASIGTLKCPLNKWRAIGKTNSNPEVPDLIIAELKELLPKMRGSTVQDVETKRKLIEIHNTVYNTNYKPNSNCNSCLAQVKKGIDNIIDKWELEEKK